MPKAERPWTYPTLDWTFDRILGPDNKPTHVAVQRTRLGKQRLLDAAAQIADEAGGQLAAAVLQLLGGCGRTHTPAAILEVCC